MKKLVLLLFVLLLPACATTHLKLENLSLGMTKEEVKATLGEPYAVRAAKIDESTGKSLELWEYHSSRFDWLYLDNVVEVYAVRFINSLLDRWGRPGDFAAEATDIKEIRFR